MNSLTQLDALCLPELISGNPVTFGFGGTDRQGTTGARDTMSMLTEGGQISDQELALLVPVSEFGTATPPVDGDKITVCVDGNGIPCHVDDSTSRINARIIQVGRAGAGLTFTLRTDAR